MKSARFLLLLVLLLGVVGGVFAQLPARTPAGSPLIDSVRVSFSSSGYTDRISGYVLDAVSRRPVPGIVVSTHAMIANGRGTWSVGYQALTNANGSFVLRLPAGARAALKKVEVQDLLLYEGQAAIPADTTQTVVILLTRNAYRFEPYACQRLADSARVAPYVKLPIRGLPGSQYAFLIRDSSARPPYRLRAITLRTGESGFPMEPIRLRIYQGNDRGKTPPGNDLLQEVVNICPRKSGVSTYDLSCCDIVVSGASFFLAVEYQVSSGKFYCLEPMAGYVPTGPILRPPCTRSASRTWEHSITQGWRRATAAENCWPVYESAISVEVEPVKR